MARFAERARKTILAKVGEMAEKVGKSKLAKFTRVARLTIRARKAKMAGRPNCSK